MQPTLSQPGSGRTWVVTEPEFSANFLDYFAVVAVIAGRVCPAGRPGVRGVCGQPNDLPPTA